MTTEAAPPPGADGANTMAAASGAGANADLLGFKPGQAAATTPPAEGANDGAGAPGSQARTLDWNGEKLEIPEQFWDSKANGPNVGALLKSQTDLRKQLSGLPKAPETYEVKVPEALSGKVEVKADDPRVQGAMGWAKKHNIPQEAFDELVALELTHQAGGFESEDQAIQAEIEADLGKLQQSLGTEAGAKIQQLDQWLVAMAQTDKGLDEGMVNAVRSLRATADGTLFLMHLRSKMGEPSIPGGEAAAPAGQLTEADLRKMQDDPRYWRDKDPAFIKKVTDGYKRLYPDG